VPVHKGVFVALEERDAAGGNRHVGRWEDRARWRDPSESDKMPNFGHYAQHMVRGCCG